MCRGHTIELRRTSEIFGPLSDWRSTFESKVRTNTCGNQWIQSERRTSRDCARSKLTESTSVIVLLALVGRVAGSQSQGRCEYTLCSTDRPGVSACRRCRFDRAVVPARKNKFLSNGLQPTLRYIAPSFRIRPSETPSRVERLLQLSHRGNWGAAERCQGPLVRGFVKSGLSQYASQTVLDWV